MVAAIFELFGEFNETWKTDNEFNLVHKAEGTKIFQSNLVDGEKWAVKGGLYEVNHRRLNVKKFVKFADEDIEFCLPLELPLRTSI